MVLTELDTTVTEHIHIKYINLCKVYIDIYHIYKVIKINTYIHTNLGGEN